MSLTVTSPRKRSAESTTTTRSMRCFCIRRLTAASEKPGRAVTSRSRGVINSETGRDSRVSKRKSRLVTMPTTRPFFSTTGKPEKPSRFLISIASPTLNSGPTVTGSETTPLSKRLTRKTSAACSTGGRFLWTTPSPPDCAMTTAIADSVTVSIAAETIGACNRNPGASATAVSTSPGKTPERPGASSTSSKVRAVSIISARFGWPRTELNRRHKDFQSSALPTELLGRKTDSRIVSDSGPPPRDGSGQ